MPTKISVLVISFNVRDHLSRCLCSVADAHDVVVVDNGSSDGSADLVRQRFPDTKLVALKHNRGFSAAVNLAAREASGNALLLLNPDAAVPRGGLRGMAVALRERGDAWALGFRQVDERGCFQLSMGLWPSLRSELARRALQLSLDRGFTWLGRTVDRLTSRAMTVPWVSGSSLLVRREAFERIGGFDERFFLYFEDFDFCLRLWSAGGRVYYEPSVSVTHRRGASAQQAYELARRAYRESQLKFWDKHRGPWMRRCIHTYLWARGCAP